MAETVGRADYELGARLDALEAKLKEAGVLVQREGEKAEKTFEKTASGSVSKLGTMTRAGITAVAGAGGALFAIAAKGAAELEDATAQYRAETGATAEEAKRAGEAINRMAGENLQSVEEIGATLTSVTTNLGLTGDEAEAASQDFLTFARATGQDATAAVADFDDLLDRFGLTAEDAGGVMDQLVASHQRYGGSIEDNQRALAGMAPQLQALNLGVDEGVGLLNLFAASGLDAATGQKALNAAIKNMPPGTSLQEIFEELSGIADQERRTRRAMEIFGTKAGAGLANAIKPGVAGLEQFIVRAEDVEGATAEARDAMDSTFGAQFEQMLKRAGSAVTGFLGQNGPLFAGLGSLASFGTSAASALKLDKHLGDVFGGLMGKIGRQVTESGAAAGAAYAGAETAGGFLGSFASKVRAGIPLALKAGMVVGLAGLADAIDEDVRNAGQEVNRRLREAMDHEGTGPLPLFHDPLRAALNDLTFTAKEQGQAVGESFVAGLVEGTNTYLGRAVQGPELVQGTNTYASGVWTSMQTSFQQADWAASVQALKDRIPGAVAEARAAAASEAAKTPEEIGRALRDNAADIFDDATYLRDVLKNGMTPEERVNRLIGSDHVKLVIEGLASRKIGARETAQGIALETLAALANRKDDHSKRHAGELIVSLMASGMDAGAIREAYPNADRINDRVKKLLKDTSGVEQGGRNVAFAWARGLGSQAALNKAEENARALARAGKGPIVGMSPPKIGPLKDVDKGGLNVGLAWAGGLLEAVPAAESAFSRLASAGRALIGPGLPGFDASMVASATVRHVVQLDLRNAPAGVTNEGVARIVRPVLEGASRRSAFRQSVLMPIYR